MSTINQVVEEVAGVLRNCSQEEYKHLVRLFKKDARFFLQAKDGQDSL